MFNGYNGGYCLINCNGLNLLAGSTPQTITGIYAATVTAIQTGKPLIAWGCKWGDLQVTPVSVFAIDWGDYLIVTASTLQIVITPQNVVTINNMAPTA